MRQIFFKGTTGPIVIEVPVIIITFPRSNPLYSQLRIFWIIRCIRFYNGEDLDFDAKRFKYGIENQIGAFQGSRETPSSKA